MADFIGVNFSLVWGKGLEDFINLISGNWPYAAWALGLGGTFYAVVRAGSAHLGEDAKAQLALYLEGSYKGTWAENFCALFDRIFGERHVSLKTMWRSAIASVLAVLALYLLFGPVLGAFDGRTISGMDMLTALGIGIFVNLIPDYLSLWETRAMLQAFKRLRNPFAQLAVLLLDLAVSALIIWGGITAFLWVTETSTSIHRGNAGRLFRICAVFLFHLPDQPLGLALLAVLWLCQTLHRAPPAPHP